MPTMEVAGTSTHLLPDGRLEDLTLWTPEIANALAERDGLSLTDAHWQVIECMRSYYREFNVSPVMKLLKKALKEQHGADAANDTHLNTLFPGGVLVQGSRIAGVPYPYLDAELERSDYANRASATGVPAPKGSFQYDGKTFRVSPDGNLLDLYVWNEDLAVYMARKENIQLTKEHWEVLNFLRRFYFEYGITPMVKLVVKHMAEELGADRITSKYLYQLFPKGPSRQGSRIAGLPEPQGCIDA